jgi:molecular chaperone DnaK (HSP70)
MKDVIIGIDLGTTNSEVAVLENGQPRVLGRKPIVPSFVGLDGEGRMLVGEPARNQYTAFPERTIKSIKRLMGKQEEVVLAGRTYSPAEISAFILMELKRIAEEELGQPVKRAVITVPAYFSDRQRQETRKAGELAGLEVLRIINEPTAAALSYEVDRQDHKRILVYDLGGGTFDVSLVNFQDGVVEVVATAGDNRLGGDDFDELIADYLMDQFQEQHGLNPADDPRAVARILRAAETGKRVLSDEPFVLIEEEFLMDKEGQPCHLRVELSRSDYEEMIDPLVDQTLEAVHRALTDANMVSADIDEVLLVGGATRTPLISTRLRLELDREPRGEISPDLCVALGAAVQAGLIAGETAHAVLVDVSPYTFGTRALDDQALLPQVVYVPIIRKNTAIPTRKTEVFQTMVDDQESVNVVVYQGEEPDPEENIRIGDFMVTGLSQVPAGSKITLTLALNLDGILEVTAIEKATGLQKSIMIDNAFAEDDPEKRDQDRQRLQQDFGQTSDQATRQVQGVPAAGTSQQRIVVTTKALIEKARRVLPDAVAEDREEIIDLIEQLDDALSQKQFDQIEEPAEQLSDILFYLEEA